MSEKRESFGEAITIYDKWIHGLARGSGPLLGMQTLLPRSQAELESGRMQNSASWPGAEKTESRSSRAACPSSAWQRGACPALGRYLIQYVILCSLFFWIMASRSMASAELSAAQAIDALDGAIQSLRSWDLYVQCSIEFFLKEDSIVDMSSGKRKFVTTNKRKLAVGEKGTVVRESYRQVFQAGKGRIDFFANNEGQGGIGGQPTVVVYDGEVLKTFHERTKSANIGIPVQNIVPGEGWDYLHTYRNIQGCWPIVRCLQERKNVICKELNANMVLLESLPCPKARVEYPGFGFRVLLDKEHGFLPAVIERSEEVQGENFTIRQTKVAEWKDVGGGVWAPLKVISRYFDSDPKWQTFGAPASEEVLVVDVARSTWNRDIPEDTFLLPLPTGTKVTDTLRGVQYVTGQSDPGKNLDDLAVHAKRVVPYPVARPHISPQRWWQREWVIGAFAGAIAVAVLFFFLRYRRRKGGVA